MSRFMGMLVLLLGLSAVAQPFNDVLVQAPQLSAPQRGSLAGQYARTAFGPAEVSRGGFGLASPFSVPTDRGEPLASPFPVYSPDGGMTEWGLGWQATLALVRTRVVGEVRYDAGDELTGPWGRLVRGADGRWYPQGMKGQVRVEEEPGDVLVAYPPDGSRWTFGGAARVRTSRGTYAWHLVEVRTATGHGTQLQWEANASGRLFVKSVAYGQGGVGEDFQYRVDFSYETLPTPFVDHRSGQPLRLDRRVSRVAVLARDANTGVPSLRWSYTPGYEQEGLGPAFYLASVRQTFASGESAPPVTYQYALAADFLPTTTLRPIPKFDTVLRDVSEAVAMPDQSTPLDKEENGWVDLEDHYDFRLIVQQEGGYGYELLPPASPGALEECRPAPSPFNRPRTLARMRPQDSAPRVVSLSYQGALGQTRLTLCERDGRPVHQSLLPDEWELGSGTRLVDLNRDRQPDLLRVFAGGYSVLPNESSSAGYAFGQPRTGVLGLGFEPTAVWVHDFNGDTVADLIVRHEGMLAVFWGLGDFRFEQEAWLVPARTADGEPVDLSRFELSFVDANKDGLTDVLLSAFDGAFLLVNTGTRLVDEPVLGLQLLGWEPSFPVVQDFAGSGDTEVFFVVEGHAYSVALDTPGTGLLKVADDGKGTQLRFTYARGPVGAGQGARQTVLKEMVVESSGQDAVTYSYAYELPRVHSVGGFLLGYGHVARQGAQVTQEMDFLHEDNVSDLLLSSRTRDANSPRVETFETLDYENASYQGVAWKRPRSQVRGWRSADGEQSLTERTDYLEYEAEVCPRTIQVKGVQGTLVTERTRASVSGLARALHCLDSRRVMTGTHPDTSLDFRYEGLIQRNAVGLVERIQSVTPGNTLVLQEVGYNPDYTVAQVSSPGRGVTTFGHEPGSHLLRQMTTPDGVVTRVTQRHPVTDAILSQEVDRGAQRYTQHFRYDGEERLERQWDSLAGSETQPKQLYSYRYATGTRPASVFMSTLVDAQAGIARDTVEYATAADEGVTQARRIPQGWVFDGVVERKASLAETRTSVRPTLAGTVDVLSLDYVALLANAQPVSFSRASTFGHEVETSTAFHADVEKQVASSLSLDAGQLTLTAWENGTWRTRALMDASQRVVAIEDEANTRFGYRYDALGRLRQVDLPDGTKHQAHYDGHGRVSLLVREGVARVEYAYDTTTGQLNLKRITSPTGTVRRQVTFTRDGLGRLLTETHSDLAGSQPLVYRYWYDGATPATPSARSALGLLSAVEGADYLKLFEYRADGKPIRHVLQLHGWRTVESEINYADNGEVSSETTTVRTQGGALLATSAKEHRWDSYGRLTEYWLNDRLFALFDYDENGQPTTADFASGGRVTLGYDPLTRQRRSLAQVAPGWSSSTDLRLNARGLVASESMAAGGTNLQRQYGYSPQGFLTSATDAGNAYSYSFDGSGLPLSITEGGVRRDFVTLARTLTVGGVTYTFDDLGRTVARDTLSLTYGPNGHVATATRGAQQWGFLYDERGQRLLKLVAGQPVAAYLEGGAYLDADGLAEPFRFGGQLVGLLKNGVFHRVATDLRGTVIANADGTFLPVSPFGNRSVHPDMAAALDYAQKGYDADTGLIRMGVRDYDPSINRFLTPDPLFLEEPSRCVDSPVECNLYVYARANPVGFTDPSGHCAASVETGIDCLGPQLAASAYLEAEARVSWSDGNYGTALVAGTLSVANGANVTLAFFAQGLLEPGNATYIATSGFIEGNYDKALEGSIRTLVAFSFARLGQSASGEAGSAMGACRGGACGIGSCFTEGTPVLTRQGLQAIEDVQVGDEVWSRSDATGESGWRRVVRTVVTPHQRVLDVELHDEAGHGEILSATGTHPFWVEGKGWTAAEDLIPGQRVPSAHGGWLRVQRVTWRQSTHTVFNFEVEDFHSYFVGGLGAWVHNNNNCFGLAQSGSINPWKVRFSQDSISAKFKDGRTISDLVKGLRDKSIKPADVAEIRVFERNGQLFTLDNRRLEAFRRAGQEIRYRFATARELADELADKFTTKNNGMSVRIRP